MNISILTVKPVVSCCWCTLRCKFSSIFTWHAVIFVVFVGQENHYQNNSWIESPYVWQLFLDVLSQMWHCWSHSWAQYLHEYVNVLLFLNLLSHVGQWLYHSLIESSYVFVCCNYSWMFCHKCDIADLILAASEDLRSCPNNAWLGQPVTHLIHKPAKEGVPGCWGSMGSCPWRLWETFQVNLNHKKWGSLALEWWSVFLPRVNLTLGWKAK